jgi:glycerol kinase
MARAALESIAFQTLDVLKAMTSDATIPIRELRVDGGATINNLLMQFQSDLLQTPVVRPKVYETTALGAAYLAGLSCGFWPSPDALQKQWQADLRFVPGLAQEKVDKAIRDWQRAVRASIAWADAGSDQR